MPLADILVDMAEITRIQELAHGYKHGTLSPEEKAEFESWLSENSDQPIEVPAGFAASATEARGRLLASIHGQIGQPAQVHRLWPRIAAAASILIACSVGGYFLFNQHPQHQQVAQVQDVAPGGNRATITLGNGKQIVLTGAKNGQLAANINKTADGEVVYEPTAKTDQVEYNTMTTPEGGEYELSLSDGTIVKLDAASSIRYPVAFNGKERNVTVTGQVYFEVKHNPAQAFKVSVKDQTIEDIGTHFNINAYEAVTTTLVEGSVRVNHKITLKPGEQTDGAGVKTVNINEIIAWTKGYFRFHDEDIASVMKQLGRWYNVEVVYQGTVSKERFNLRITRSRNISSVLNALEKTQKSVHFKIEGRRVTVLSKS